MMTYLADYFYFNPTINLVLCAIFSLVVGSFLNVVIYRLPIMIDNVMKSQSLEYLCLAKEAGLRELNLSYPRSHCVSCLSKIPAWHNIPLLSYILLKGKCKKCGSSISITYPLVELLTMILSLIAVQYFGYNRSLLYVLPFIWILICLSFIDFKKHILPDCLTISLLWLGLLANIDELFTSLPFAIYGAVTAYLSLWIFIKLFYLVTGKIGMGNGDFKLFAALGAWFGWNSLVFILLISSILGTIIGAIYLCMTKKERSTPIPFGPFLCIAGFSYLFLTEYILWPLSAF